MGHSKVLTLRRAFVKLLLTLAATYAVTLTLTRDSGEHHQVVQEDMQEGCTGEGSGSQGVKAALAKRDDARLHTSPSRKFRRTCETTKPPYPPILRTVE